VPEKNAEKSKVRVKYLMENAWELAVGPLLAPLTVEAAVGYNWHEAK
jgi:DNA polymerase I-like protein with 3'-5' exonuclease and polymerase domains